MLSTRPRAALGGPARASFKDRTHLDINNFDSCSIILNRFHAFWFNCLTAAAAAAAPAAAAAAAASALALIYAVLPGLPGLLGLPEQSGLPGLLWLLRPTVSFGCASLVVPPKRRRPVSSLSVNELVTSASKDPCTQSRSTVVCEIITHLDGAGVFNVPTPV